jgi:hypothetical protein
MKLKIKSKIIVLFTGTLLFTACKLEKLEDPNNPSSGGIIINATLGELQNLVTGTEAAMRESISFYMDDVGVIGREFYRFSTSDPRFTSDLLGKGSAVLDNNTFYITNPFASRYRVIKNANILIEALTNTKAAISENQRKAGIAYAKTVQAHQYLMVLNLLYNNGIRFDVKDPDNLGPFLTKDQSIDAILSLLNEANADLKNNNVSFPFSTTLWSNNAAEFSKFNRALAARVAVYKGDWATANTALSESFLSINGPLDLGVYHLFSTAGNDVLNPMFYPLDSDGETRVAQPNFVTEADPGDDRLSKVVLRTSPAFQDGLTSNYDFFVYTSNVDRIPVIRNEELILLYAEVKAQTNQTTEAVNAINRIRNTAGGLVNYGGATDLTSLINEILKQRRYSLYGEGHRWIDMRRYNRLAQLPIDRAGDDVWVQFPIPVTEQ